MQTVGESLQMMKPDYKAMTKGELRAYVLSHHEDIEALSRTF